MRRTAVVLATAGAALALGAGSASAATHVWAENQPAGILAHGTYTVSKTGVTVTVALMKTKKKNNNFAVFLHTQCGAIKCDPWGIVSVKDLNKPLDTTFTSKATKSLKIQTCWAAAVTPPIKYGTCSPIRTIALKP
jgi:hypothetical protein